MGYTHYFNTVKTPSTKQWREIKTACNKILAVGHKLGLIAEEMNTTTPPHINDSQIMFNGSTMETGHETFLLSREAGNSEFCKTARKKYDVFVVACLIIAKRYAPDCFEVATDGGAEDWQDGRGRAIFAMGARDGVAVEIGQNTTGLPPTFTIDLGA